MANKRLIEQVEDILSKWELFYGQRAGRELWAEKPKEVQDKDIENFCKDLSVVRSAIVDAVEVVHARWEQIGYDVAMDRITCSHCKEYWNIIDNCVEDFNYCPNCGAKMDGGNEDGNT